MKKYLAGALLSMMIVSGMQAMDDYSASETGQRPAGPNKLAQFIQWTASPKTGFWMGKEKNGVVSGLGASICSVPYLSSRRMGIRV